MRPLTAACGVEGACASDIVDDRATGFTCRCPKDFCVQPVYLQDRRVCLPMLTSP